MEQRSWELPEIVVVSALAAVSALAIGGLASGIAGVVEASNPLLAGESTAGILIQSTAWADSFAAFMVLIALLVIWWRVQTWSEVIHLDEDALEFEEFPPESAEEPFSDYPVAEYPVAEYPVAENTAADDDDEPTGDLTDAVLHVLRGRALAVWAGISTVVVVASAIVYFVGYQVDLSSDQSGFGFVWELRSLQIGSLAATLLLGTAGVLGTIWVRRLCAPYRTIPMEEDMEDLTREHG
jgi:hypothetical protein